MPRIIPAGEWLTLEQGLKQRVKALNLFLHDIYHGQSILKAGVIPAERVLSNTQYRREMQGMEVPGGIYAHVAGVDVVRAGEGDYYVLEDNLRVPSGVSYMLENRKMMMRLFPELFATQAIKPVEHYPDLLLETLHAVAPASEDHPEVAVLTPGAYNSAYFEHAFLAQQMGVELVAGPGRSARLRYAHDAGRRVLLYRRVDDDYLTRVRAFHAACRTPHLPPASDPGQRHQTGVADDKSIYPYVPDMIRFYLTEADTERVPNWQLPTATRPLRLHHLPPGGTLAQRRPTVAQPLAAR